MAEEVDHGFEGRILGDEYVIVGPLPSHGPGAPMFEGRHLRLGYRVAIRLTPRQVASRVTTEAEALARVRHPALPVVLARGVLEVAEVGYEYCVREFAEGQPLGVLLRASGRLDPLRAVRIVRQMLAAVGELHTHGVVHGDLKPENIIVDDTDADRVRVIDLASAVLDGTCHEREGTPRYMAPELAQGAVPNVRSDLYAVGVILRECIVGETPPTREATRSWQGNQNAHGGESMADGLCLPGLRLLLERATAPSAETRIGSAADFATALATLDEAELATRYLGTFPPSTRQDQDTIDLSPLSDAVVRGSATLRERPPLSSLGRPTVWVMTGAPSIAQVTVQTALAQLAKEVDLRFLDEKSRASIRIELQQRRVAPPWVLVFGDLHALLGDALLADLACEGETMRMLVSSHINLELTQSTINTTGLDWQVCLPCSVREIMGAVMEMVERSGRRRRYYDGLRLAVGDAAALREELSRHAESEGMR